MRCALGDVRLFIGDRLWLCECGAKERDQRRTNAA
jgi:hypothetical protein